MADYNESYGILQVLWGEIHQLLMKWRMEKLRGFHRIQDKAFAPGTQCSIQSPAR